VPADGRVLGAVAAVAIATDVAVRAGGIGLGGALLVVVVAAGVLATRRPHGLQASLLIAAAPVFGVWLFLRTSPWLLLPDLVAATGLLALGVSLGRRSLLDLTLPAAAAHGIRVLGHSVAGPTYVVAAAQTVRPPADQVLRARARAVVRGVLLAAPLLLVLGILLASADVGLTMLRLYSTVFAYWVGAVFILLGLVLAGVARRRAWLPSVAVGIGLVGLLWLNVANPEAIVVRHNVTFAERSGRFDPAYVSNLSDDAIPTLVDSLPDLDAPAHGLVLTRLCPPRPPERAGWASYNAARDRAFESLTAACAGRIGTG
jgi:hypothetical protein